MSKIPHNFSTNLIKNGQTKQNKSVINNPYKNSIAT